jgi:hypothetical protein
MLKRFIQEHGDLIRKVWFEWRNNFLTLTLNEDKAERLVDFLYEVDATERGVNHSKVKTYFVDSPLAICKFASNPFYDEISEFAKPERANRYGSNTVERSIAASFSSHVLTPVVEQVKDYMLSRFWSTYSYQVQEQVNDHIDKYFRYGFKPKNLKNPNSYQVKEKAYSDMLSLVKLNLLSKVWERYKPRIAGNYSLIRHAIEQVFIDFDRPERLHRFQFSEYGGFTDIEWVSYFDAFHRLGIVKDLKFALYKQLLKSNSFLFLPLNTCAFVVKPPEVLKLNDTGRLHCVDGPALRFADGYEQYWVRGVFFPADLFRRFFEAKKITGRDILNLSNVEQKSVLIQHFGYDMIMDDLQEKKVLDVDEVISQVTGKPAKCELIDCVLDRNRLRFVRVEDHTTHKVVTLGVPIVPETETCRGAIAWTFGMSEEEYVPLMET